MYNIIKKDIKCEITEKKSKFIAHLMYVENKIDAEKKLKEIQKEYHDARHNCYAYRILEDNEIYEKASDDGEPSGTAGQPMLALLKGNDLVNCIVVVTRYFGGILLGTGGLVRAYSEATSNAIQSADLAKVTLGTEYEVTVDYSNYQNLEYYCRKNGIKINNVVYGENIVCNIVVENKIFCKNLKVH